MNVTNSSLIQDASASPSSSFSLHQTPILIFFPKGLSFHAFIVALRKSPGIRKEALWHSWERRRSRETSSSIEQASSSSSFSFLPPPGCTIRRKERRLVEERTASNADGAGDKVGEKEEKRPFLLIDAEIARRGEKK